MKEADIDGNGSLDIDEFSSFIEKVVFNKFDSDGSGSIDAKELSSAVKSLGIECDAAKLKKIMK
jgi:Ca2+-binding EF-hand superfamily protein